LAGGGSFSKNVGDEISFSITAGGSANQYQWLKDGNEIEGANSNSYEIASITNEDAGVYNLRVTSTLVPELTLFSQSFTLSVTAQVKQSQTITFSELSNRTIGDAPFTVSATATSGLTASFNTASDKISLEGSQVTIIKAGQVTITASQMGNDDFFAAESVDQTFCINPAKPAITFDNDLDNPILISSNTAGNQWYLDGAKIDGATGVEYEISEPGSYTIQTTVEECASAFSDEFVIVITALEESRVSKQLDVFPNPASEKVSLRLPDGGGRISVLNQNGVSLHQQTTTESSIELKIASYNQGLYLVKVTTAKGNHFTKFIKD
jgi:3-deoxy-D-manno-octulosonate 8-phosphate phosphatase KdsC-like HAD superfamily phosphatase